jgi:hypothetical protein
LFFDTELDFIHGNCQFLLNGFCLGMNRRVNKGRVAFTIHASYFKHILIRAARHKGVLLRALERLSYWWQTHL